MKMEREIYVQGGAKRKSLPYSRNLVLNRIKECQCD